MKILATNKRAIFDYIILDKIEAGISLLGHEVKSAKAGGIHLGGSYAKVGDGGIYLINADIEPYQPKNISADYERTRTRQLLLTKKEIAYLLGKQKEAGLTVVPLRAYIKGRLVKIELGLARHKRKVDKREAIKKKDTEREIGRTLKR